MNSSNKNKRGSTHGKLVPSPSGKGWHGAKKKFLPYLLVSPYLIFVFVFVLFPVFFCFFLTFQKWNIIAPMRFIGLDNYSRLVHDRLFWKAIFNTLKFLLLHIPLQLVVSLFLAYLLNQKMRASAFFQRFIFYAGNCFRSCGYHFMATITWAGYGPGQ